MEKRQFGRRFLKYLIGFAVLLVLIYGAGRLYFEVTGGFRVGNITSDFKHDARWDIAKLKPEEQQALSHILSQPYHFLGKGCQSYVFESADDQYVIKFFKYQHYRQKPWLNWFSFIEPVAEFRERSLAKKKKLFNGFFSSWKLGYEYLGAETGIVYVHLNKTNELNQQIHIYDKMGIKHTLDADRMEFLVQKKAALLCPTINEFMAMGEENQAKQLITNIVLMIVSEYKRGIVDKDHALMQNTGVYQGRPMHVDVGQFIFEERILDPAIADQELFNQTYKLRLWLQQKHPSLNTHLENELKNIMGDNFNHLKYVPKVKV
jgi:hypothetical protein